MLYLLHTQILTKDSVTVFVNAIMYYKVANATHAVSNVDDYSGSARLLAATTLRNVLGTKSLGDILSERESIASEMQEMLHEATEPWGVEVERVEVKDVRVPEQLQRAMAAEAEAAREARAKVIAAEGEHQASRALKHAAEIISESPAALQVFISLEIIIQKKQLFLNPKGAQVVQMFSAVMSFCLSVRIILLSSSNGILKVPKVFIRVFRVGSFKRVSIELQESFKRVS